MKPGTSAAEEIIEVHAPKSPSPKQTKKNRSHSTSKQNGHDENCGPKKPGSSNSKSRDSWIKSEHESLDTELPIQDQIKQDILGFVAKEMEKTDKPSFIFYSHDPNELDEKFMKTLSRPSSGHKEKRNPSYRRKKRHSSKHRDKDLDDFVVAGSSLSALEKVDDYLKQYNKEEVVTLSGDLEIEVNGENNNIVKTVKHKNRKGKRKSRDEQQRNARDVSPKVFQTANKNKSPARPTNISTVLNSLESGTSYQDRYIDNPFSSPSPLTSPNDGKDFIHKPQKIYIQGGGTFRQISSERTIDTQKSDDDKYFRLGDKTSLDIALQVQKAWQLLSPACHGILAGLSLMHLITIECSDNSDVLHLGFHSQITAPYAATYQFLCVLCVVSVLDRLDIPSMNWREDIFAYLWPMVLVALYAACLLISSAANMYDEQIVLGMNSTYNNIGNDTVPIPSFYTTWMHFSICRSVLPIIALIVFITTNPKDLVYANLSSLLQFQHSLQSIG